MTRLLRITLLAPDIVRLVVAIALANRMARRLWAMLTKDKNYRDPALVA